MEELNAMEAEAIKYYNSTNDEFGYNIEPGGNNYERSEETKRKIGLANKNRKSKKEIERLVLMNKSRTGLKLSEETKKKMSEAAKGRKRNPESEAKRRASFMEGYASGRSKSRKGIPNYLLRDQTVYEFKHADGRIFKGSSMDFQLLFESSAAAIKYIVTKKESTTKGWFVVPPSDHKATSP